MLIETKKLNQGHKAQVKYAIVHLPTDDSHQGSNAVQRLRKPPARNQQRQGCQNNFRIS